MKTTLLFLASFVCICKFNNLYAQNSMTGDGFGGRGWYVPHNYQVGAYSAYTVCGDSSQLYAWGANLSGELGNNSTVQTSYPVAAIGMKNVKFYTTGYVSAVIKKDNTAWVWGTYPGVPSGFTRVPTQILTDVRFADGGISHVAFIKNDSTVWVAGDNVNGALGNGLSTPTIVTSPVQMTGIHNAVRVASVGSSNNANSATLILLADGTVKVTGGGGWFQSTNSTVPVLLPGLTNIVDIKGGAYAAYALNAVGEVFSFGIYYHITLPVLGLANAVIGVYTPPTKVIFPVGASPIVALSANNDGYHCLALDSSHKVYGWGRNYWGVFGDGSIAPKLTPALLATNVVDIFAGETFSYILKADNTLWATGASGSPNSSYPDYGSIWMNLPNFQRNVFTQIDPIIPPMNLCPPKLVPIQLLNFNCTAVGNNANLTWESSEEINFNKYVIEYSKDGFNFQSIAFINAKGAYNKYYYTHQEVSGIAFYRIKMVDNDASFKYSEIRVVKFENKIGLTIVPNPVIDVAHVFSKNNNAIKSLQLLSVDGKLLRTVNDYRNGEPINMSPFSDGIYILKTNFRNGEAEYGRVVKM